MSWQRGHNDIVPSPSSSQCFFLVLHQAEHQPEYDRDHDKRQCMVGVPTRPITLHPLPVSPYDIVWYFGIGGIYLAWSVLRVTVTETSTESYWEQRPITMTWSHARPAVYWESRKGVFIPEAEYWEWSLSNRGLISVVMISTTPAHNRTFPLNLREYFVLDIRNLLIE